MFIGLLAKIINTFKLQTLNALRLDNLETSMIGQLSKSNLEITN